MAASECHLPAKSTLGCAPSHQEQCSANTLISMEHFGFSHYQLKQDLNPVQNLSSSSMQRLPECCQKKTNSEMLQIPKHLKSLKTKYLHPQNFAIFLVCLVIEVNTS